MLPSVDARCPMSTTGGRSLKIILLKKLIRHLPQVRRNSSARMRCVHLTMEIHT